MKTKIKTLGHSISGAACAAALLMGLSASAQDLYVASCQPGIIDEFNPGGTLSGDIAGMDYPVGMAFDSAGDVFVANSANDSGGGYITKITPGGVQSTFYSGLDPKGLAFNSAGDLFESDYHSGNIYEYTPSGVRSTFASGFTAPDALAFNSAGDLFVSDGYTSGTCRITEITPSGTQSLFASGLGGAGGLAFNDEGDLFEADYWNGDIYEFTPGGARSTFASGLIPNTIVINNADDLFEADSSGNVYEFTPSGVRSTIATGITQPNGMAIEGLALPVPEPSTWALLAAGAAAFLLRSRRKE